MYWLVLGFLVAWACFIFVARYRVLRKRRHARLIKSFEDIDTMNGREFEEFLAALFRQVGFICKTTKASGDFGADLILVQNGQITIAQIKRSINTIGVSAVQQVTTAKAHYGALNGWVVTNNYYTASAKQLAKDNQIRLIDRDELKQIFLTKTIEP